jgi:hypothetical protein
MANVQLLPPGQRPHYTAETVEVKADWAGDSVMQLIAGKVNSMVPAKGSCRVHPLFSSEDSAYYRVNYWEGGHISYSYWVDVRFVDKCPVINNVVQNFPVVRKRRQDLSW